MKAERKIPEWARQEREGDLVWIAENIHVFWPLARAAFKEQGKGAFFVDTTSRPIAEKGHPFGYFPQEVWEEWQDEDILRMVREYNPKQEFVVVLWKKGERTSTYRVQAIRPSS